MVRHTQQFVSYCRWIVWVCLTILWGWRLKEGLTSRRSFFRFGGFWSNLSYTKLPVTQNEMELTWNLHHRFNSQGKYHLVEIRIMTSWRQVTILYYFFHFLRNLECTKSPDRLITSSHDKLNFFFSTSASPMTNKLGSMVTQGEVAPPIKPRGRLITWLCGKWKKISCYGSASVLENLVQIK